MAGELTGALARALVLRRIDGRDRNAKNGRDLFRQDGARAQQGGRLAAEIQHAGFNADAAGTTIDHIVDHSVVSEFHLAEVSKDIVSVACDFLFFRIRIDIRTSEKISVVVVCEFRITVAY